ncbi:NERD domain-containing protein [Pontibacillus litoralis]|uniref:NERD domain-containing protein n=1 Tax=Pontibacillus litoralis JSM 072002 TaxID=1385512 RepID=A0A0A5GAX7_9BACI|nr:NERD domain-containing protein [Pontibacillus litoralis]KGX88270.1 hypothetical protein N784_10700 [Pontibacillus litoralis JSM 072002]
MIVKTNTIPPLFLQQLESLSHRLPPHHEKYGEVIRKYRMHAAGYAGEKSLLYPFRYINSPHAIFFDLRLRDSIQHYFQMDALLLTPTCCIIFEVKNISGTIYFDPHFQQLIRKDTNQETSLPDPLSQVKRQKQHLSHWFISNHFYHIPIETVVVVTNQSSVIQAPSTHNDAYNQVVRVENLLGKIEGILGRHQEKKLSNKQLTNIKKSLLDQHTDYCPTIMKMFHLKEDDLCKGIACPQCHHKSMYRKNGKWNCIKCDTTSKTAHVAGIKDYALLIGHSATNAALRDFLKIESRHLMLRILHGLHLPQTGAQKNRMYSLAPFLSRNHEFPRTIRDS